MAQPFGVEHFPIDPALSLPAAPPKRQTLPDFAIGLTFFITITIAMCAWLYVLFLLLRAAIVWLWA
jgi:hypothetical protein